MEAAVREHSGRKCGKRFDVSRGSTRMLAHLGLNSSESQPCHEKRGLMRAPYFVFELNLYFDSSSANSRYD